MGRAGPNEALVPSVTDQPSRASAERFPWELLAILFLFLVHRVIAHGPLDEPVPSITSGAPVTTV